MTRAPLRVVGGGEPVSFAQRLTATLIACDPDIRALIFIGVEKVYGPGFAILVREWVRTAEAAAELEAEREAMRGMD